MRTSRAVAAATGAAVLVLSTMVASTPSAADDPVVRAELQATTRDGVRLAAREVRLAAAPGPGGRAVVLVHGARVPGVPSFDLDVPGGSLAADLARAGHVVFVPDLRGYGRSERPAAYDEPPEANPPGTRLPQALRDLDAVVGLAQARTGAREVALLGWATGGMWAGAYAALEPERVSHLVAFNALHGGSAAHPSLREAPRGAWRASDAGDLLPSWDRSIPGGDKAAWRDPAVAAAYVAAAIASDEAGSRQDLPVMRAPTGALADSALQAAGRQLYDADTVDAHALVVRSGRDFWSRPEDARTLHDQLRGAASRRLVELDGATHHAHLDRPERGRARLLDETLALLAR